MNEQLTTSVLVENDRIPKVFLMLRNTTTGPQVVSLHCIHMYESMAAIASQWDVQAFCFCTGPALADNIRNTHRHGSLSSSVSAGTAPEPVTESLPFLGPPRQLHWTVDLRECRCGVAASPGSVGCIVADLA